MKLVMFMIVLCMGPLVHASAAGDVCNYLAGVDGGYGERCVVSLSKGTISDSSAQVCMTVSQENAGSGVTCMDTATTMNLDPSALSVCNAVARVDGGYGVRCLQAAAGKVYSADIIQVCTTVTNSNAAEGITCMQNAGTVPAAVAKPATSACMTPAQIVQRVSIARYAIDHNRQVNASKILSDLEDALKTCH